jgi:hypothetical protein
MVFFVENEPVPAMTGTRPLAIATARFTSSTCSSSVSVGDSPVVPQGTSPAMPPVICRSQSAS